MQIIQYSQLRKSHENQGHRQIKNRKVQGISLLGKLRCITASREQVREVAAAVAVVVISIALYWTVAAIPYLF